MCFCFCFCLAGLIRGHHDAGETGEVHTKYFVLAHYSRHVRPGFHVISCVSSSTEPQLQPQDESENESESESKHHYHTVAAVHEPTKTVVVVTSNLTTTPLPRAFDLCNLTWGDFSTPTTVCIWRTQIHGADRYKRQVCECVFISYRVGFVSYLGSVSCCVVSDRMWMGGWMDGSKLSHTPNVGPTTKVLLG